MSTPYDYVDKCKCNECNKVENSDFLFVLFINILNFNCKLNTATGILSIELLDTVIFFFDIHNIPKRVRKLSTKERIKMTFIEFKLDVSYTYYIMYIILDCYFPNKGLP